MNNKNGDNQISKKKPKSSKKFCRRNSVNESENYGNKKFYFNYLNVS